MPFQVTILIAIAIFIILALALAAYILMLKKVKKVSEVDVSKLIIKRNKELKIIVISLISIGILSVICGITGLVIKNNILSGCGFGIFLIMTFLSTFILFQIKKTQSNE